MPRRSRGEKCSATEAGRFFENWIVRASTHNPVTTKLAQASGVGQMRVSVRRRRVDRSRLSVRAETIGGDRRPITD